ncbi:unnamed protein product [Ceutorhynchus assimilis]|uniref:Uncharacterized protein n=1 Tax=Ceutorhynchus assimilis TaxID=467358 RepID=A0A9P0DCL2_9CUCU|nr:unnamed protein product [Ceutorhynchus assimilis]
MKFNFLIIHFFLIYTILAKDEMTISEMGDEKKKKNLGQQAANIAQKAATDAKAAQDAMQQAGAQAARQVKTQLAEKAAEAAKSALAALAGKEELVQKLKEQLKEAEVVVNEEASNLQQLQQTVQAASKAAQQAQTALKLLQTTLQLTQGKCCQCKDIVGKLQLITEVNTDIFTTLNDIPFVVGDNNAHKCNTNKKGNAGNSQHALEGSQDQLADKEELVEAAKGRVDQLNKDLRLAKIELAKTRDSAKKAEQSAVDAKQLAARNTNRKKRSMLENVNIR